MGFNIDYRNILEDEHYELDVERVDGLVGNRMYDFIEIFNENTYSTDVKFLSVRFEDGEKFGDIRFEDLGLEEYWFSGDHYHFYMKLYKFRGDVVNGYLSRTLHDEDNDEEIELVGFDDSVEVLNKVMLYVLGKIQNRLV